MIYLKRSVKVVGGRDGKVSTPNQSIDLTLGKPVEMGGSPSNKTNPEELFLAGYTTCLASSFEFLSEKSGVVYSSIEIEGEILLAEDEKNGGFKFAVELVFNIQGMDEEAKAGMVEKTFAFCPFSKAIKNNVDVTFKIK